MFTLVCLTVVMHVLTASSADVCANSGGLHVPQDFLYSTQSHLQTGALSFPPSGICLFFAFLFCRPVDRPCSKGSELTFLNDHQVQGKIFKFECLLDVGFYSVLHDIKNVPCCSQLVKVLCLFKIMKVGFCQFLSASFDR